MIYENDTFDEERALYAIHDSVVKNCRFCGPKDGESFLKETRNIEVRDCFMDLRYPLWHVSSAEISGCEMTENCRAALWYDSDIKIDGCIMNGIKAVRECEKVELRNCTVNSPEFIWKVKDLVVEDCRILESEYPFFEVKDARISKLTMKGKYSFQYCSGITIDDSDFDTKDAFWHASNMTIRNSVIKSEYLAWYSENLTFENCRIIGTQPFCYCKNLVLKNCTMEGCDLSFERSEVNASIKGKILSVKNPISGCIQAQEIGEIIIDESIGSKTECEFRIG